MPISLSIDHGGTIHTPFYKVTIGLTLDLTTLKSFVKREIKLDMP